MNELAYSFSLTTFSPTGHLRQITHALAAVESGRLSVGIKCEGGVILLCHKQNESPLVDYSTVRLVVNVSPQVGITYSGFSADFRNLLSLCRKANEKYFGEFQEPMPVNMIARDLAATMQEYTQQGGVRPFGCSVLLAGRSMADEHTIHDTTGKKKHGYVLYQVDSSGSYYTWKATANGKGSNQAREFLERKYVEAMSVTDGIILGLSCLQEYVDGDVTSDTVEVGVVSEDDGLFHQLSKQEIEEYLKQIE